MTATSPAMTWPRKLTTHVLDTASGKPAAGLRVVLRRADAPAVLSEATTNADGRLDKPLLDGDALKAGVYEISFHAGDYFRKPAPRSPTRPFLTWCRCALRSPRRATPMCRC